MGLSLEQRLALLTRHEQEQMLEGLDLEELVHDWRFRARPEQYVDPLDTSMRVEVLGAGRGSGKSLAGSNWIKDCDAADHAPRTGGGPLRFSLVGRTAADVRDVMINGETGILNAYPPSLRDEVQWTPTRRELLLPGGSIGLTFSAEEPDQLRGPQSHISWCFTAGTGVETEHGRVPIEEVGAGDLVWTRRGLRPVVATGSRVAEVATLHHQEGSLTGTLDHPVWTQRGWVPLGLVTPTDILTGWRGLGRSTNVEGTGANAVPGRIGPACSVPTTSGDEAGTRSSVPTAERSSSPEVGGIAVRGVSTSGLVTRVFDLKVSGTPEFFASGVLVHNCDELAAWKEKPGVDGLTAWDNVRIGTRLGPVPQILATTTPKRTPQIRRLWAEAAADGGVVRLRRMATRDNVFLSEAYMDVLESLWGGTVLGSQELDGELLADVEGALLAASVIDAYRVAEADPRATAVVIGVDPSVASRPRDECGIIVVSATREKDPLRRHAYVLDDTSLRGSPGVWSKQVVSTAHDHKRDGMLPTVVVEGNQGGDMVRTTLREAAAAMDVVPPRVAVVSATRSKRARAEPVVAATERGRVHHVAVLPDLEDQWTTWSEGAGYSPDRMDAAVHAISAVLFPATLTGGLTGGSTVHSAAGRVLPMDSVRARGRLV